MRTILPVAAVTAALACGALSMAAAESADRVARAFQAAFGRPLYAIGEITATGRMELVDAAGNTAALAPTGWDHFRRP